MRSPCTARPPRCTVEAQPVPGPWPAVPPLLRQPSTSPDTAKCPWAQEGQDGPHLRSTDPQGVLLNHPGPGRPGWQGRPCPALLLGRQQCPQQPLVKVDVLSIHSPASQPTGRKETSAHLERERDEGSPSLDTTSEPRCSLTPVQQPCITTPRPAAPSTELRLGPGKSCNMLTLV